MSSGIISLLSNTKSIHQWDIPGTGPQPWEGNWMSFGNYGPYGNLPYAHVVTFNSVPLPSGIRIISAIPKYKAQGNYSNNTCKVKLYFTDSANPSHPTGRVQAQALSLTAGVSWTPISGFVTGSWYEGPDLKDILQTIVDKSTWASGNHLQLVCRDDSSTNAAYRASFSSSSIDIVITYGDPVPEENKITGVVVNQRISPYKAGTADKIQLKYGLYSNNEGSLSYIKNANLELKLNHISGVFNTYASGVTDSYGTYTFYYPCTNISGINNCLGYVTTIINNEIYDSNIVRFNFI